MRPFYSKQPFPSKWQIKFSYPAVDLVWTLFSWITWWYKWYLLWLLIIFFFKNSFLYFFKALIYNLLIFLNNVLQKYYIDASGMCPLNLFCQVVSPWSVSYCNRECSKWRIPEGVSWVDRGIGLGKENQNGK